MKPLCPSVVALSSRLIVREDSRLMYDKVSVQESSKMQPNRRSDSG